MSDVFDDDFALEAVDFQVLLLADERIVLRLDLLAANLELKLFTHCPEHLQFEQSFCALTHAHLLFAQVDLFVQLQHGLFLFFFVIGFVALATSPCGLKLSTD